MEMSGQLYALAALPMLHTEFVAEWDPETVCMIGKEKNLPLPAKEPRLLGSSDQSLVN
jgi:hypothetical protein